MDYALNHGWDTKYGGMFAGHFSDKNKTIYKDKTFWIQLETLWALIAFYKYEPDNSEYNQYLFGTWKYIKQYLTDEYHHGIHESGTDTLPLMKKWLLKTPKIVTKKYACKGNMWKDASHSGRALLRSIHALEKSDSEDWMTFPLSKLLEYRDTSAVQ